MNLNYYNTLIAVAEDCPTDESIVPVALGAKKTVAVLQYEMLAEKPYVYTQEDVLFESWLQRQDMPGLSPGEIARLRAEFFSRSQACLRASPLPKQYGWGLAFDEQGRVALCPVESDEYRQLAMDSRLTVVKAMRSKRARP